MEVFQENRAESENDIRITNDELQEIIFTNYKVLLEKEKFNEAFSLFKHYIFDYPSYLNEDRYLIAHCRYTEAAEKYNEYVMLLLNDLLYRKIKDFPYLDLVNIFQPIILKGKYLRKRKVTQYKPKTPGKPMVTGNMIEYETVIDVYDFIYRKNIN